jgi:hypothetical protein
MKYITTTIAALALCACTTTGQVASKTNGPVDKNVTRLALCSGAQKVDIAFQGIAIAAPGVIPAKVMDAEGAAADGLGFVPGKPDAARDGSLCAKVYAGDVDVAINTAIKAAMDITALMAKWKQ